jgi:hypothetical protein
MPEMKGPAAPASANRAVSQALSKPENTAKRQVPARTSHRSHGLFEVVNAAALPILPALLRRWLPDGMTRGREYIARNPRRDDRHVGSFSVNVKTGRWADFATGDQGGDVVSLAAYLAGISQLDAARRLATMLGVKVSP